jgi:hypothetical protein
MRCGKVAARCISRARNPTCGSPAQLLNSRLLKQDISKKNGNDQQGTSYIEYFFHTLVARDSCYLSGF